MTKEKGRPTRKNSGLSERLAVLLSKFQMTQKSASKFAIGADGKPTRLSVFHGWLNGAHCTDYMALKNLCISLSSKGKEQISFEWLLTGEAPSTSSPLIQNDSDLAKLFLQEDEVFDGYLRVKISKVTHKKTKE